MLYGKKKISCFTYFFYEILVEMFEPGDMYEYKMNTKPKHSYPLLFLFFKDLFFQCMDMFANSDSGGDEVPDGADDEAKDPHGRGAVHEHDHGRGNRIFSVPSLRDHSRTFLHHPVPANLSLALLAPRHQ